MGTGYLAQQNYPGNIRNWRQNYLHQIYLKIQSKG